jgi:anti-sigma factor RsiW
MSAAIPDDLQCKELVEVITDYLEGAMPHHERTRLEQHLVSCPPCRVYVQQMRETIRVTGQRPTEDAIAPSTKSVLLSAFRSWKKGA